MISKKIEEIMKRKSIAKKDLAKELVMPLSTLSNKFKNNTFTAEELMAIKKILGVNLSAFEDFVLFEANIQSLGNVDIGNPNTISPIQFVSDNSKSYVIAAAEDNGVEHFLCIEDWEIRDEIVVRFRDAAHLAQLCSVGFSPVYEEVTLREILGTDDVYKKTSELFLTSFS